ncbi:putative DNA circulation family protein [uncultured Alphaproteobacteria bacterium]|uniref:Putative DNA circulation family protein n=1 Tax=uncultured Alphaproteobacteria bacterium TaxID=91750 RepID=A0A212KK29_9PROT|nr:putative DNA circulation family protein [uncultured Alphaproteobacteria bacterium]
MIRSAAVLRSASFRGVPFKVEVSDDAFGRRGVHHEFPQRDRGAWEDLGDGDPTYALEAFVIGADALARAKALIAACREPGYGALVHPLWGTLNVVCTSPRLRVDYKTARIATLSLSFVEAGPVAQPSTADDGRLRTTLAAEAAADALMTRFAGAVNVAGLPGWVAESAAATLADGIGAIADGVGQLPLADGMEPYLDGAVDLLADLVTIDPRRLDAMAVVSLASRRLLVTGAGVFANPPGLARSVVGMGRMVSISHGTPAAAYAAQRSLWSFVPAIAAGVVATGSRMAEATNANAVGDLVRTSAVIEAARMTPAMEFESYQDLACVRDDLAEALDGEMLGASDDGLFDALAGLRSSVITDLNTRAELPSLVSWSPTATTPAVVAAYDIYDDPAREAEILARNPGIPHPGMIPGGDALEVLNG